MHNKARSPAALFCIVSFLTSCSADLTVPADAEIACASSDDCPSSYACLVSIGRCVVKDGDISLPHVIDAAVTPRIATRGSDVTIELTVDAALAGPPTTTLTWGDGGTREARYVSNDGLVYRMAYTVGDDESGVFL